MKNGGLTKMSAHRFLLYPKPTVEGSLDGFRLLDARVGGHVVGNPDVASDDRVVADGDTAEDGGIGIDRDVILDDGVTRHVENITVLIIFETLSTEGNALIEGDVIANDTRLANDDASAVVDGEIFANLCTRMDVDTRLRMCLLGDDTWDDGHFQFMQFVGYAIVRHGVDDGIAEDDLTVVGCGRVVVEHGLNVGIEQAFDFRQCVDELQCQPFSFFVNLLLGLDGLAVLTKLQSVGYLLAEQTGEFLHVYTDVVRAYILVGLAFVEIVWEDDILHETDYLPDLFDRGQGRIDSGHHAHLLLGHLGQQSDIFQ